MRISCFLPRLATCTGCPKKVSAFDQQQNESLLFSILDEALLDLDFDIKIVKIR